MPAAASATHAPPAVKNLRLGVNRAWMFTGGMLAWPVVSSWRGRHLSSNKRAITQPALRRDVRATGTA